MSDDSSFFDDLDTEMKSQKEEAKPEEKEIVVDLAEVPPEKRELVAAGAKNAGMKVINEHLLAEARKPLGPDKPLLLEFPENPPSEAQEMIPLFRLSRRKDLDILFCGLNIGPSFQDKLEEVIKEKFQVESSKDGIYNEHFVVFVYLALALPFGGNDSMDSGWSLTYFPPKSFERIIPKAMRTRLGIDIWYKQAGNRFDVIYYKVQKVKAKEEVEETITNMKRTSNIAYALTTMNAPYPEVPKETIEKWIEEYYEKNPNMEREVSEVSEKESRIDNSEKTDTEKSQEDDKTALPETVKPAPARSSLF